MGKSQKIVYGSEIDKSAIKSVVINEGIVSIGDLTFSNCYNLTNIIIPNSVTSIGKDAFFCCENLINIIIPNSVTNIGERAFANCDNLTSVTMPTNLTDISQFLFWNCINLTDITIPNNVTKICKFAFHGCKSLTEITIPDKVEIIDENAFASCVMLKDVNVSKGNKNFQSIDGVLFSKDLTELIFYPFGKKATTYEIPASTTHIKRLSFDDNDTLETIILSEKVTTIEEFSFSYCEGLKKVVIPDTVTTMEGNSIFYDSFNVVMYCKSNSVAHNYAKKHVEYVIDDTAPTINKIEQDGSYISVIAEDNNNGVGIATKAYSLDGINWTGDSKIKVNETKTYTVYVKDYLNNVTTQDINIDVTNTLVGQNIIKIPVRDTTNLAEKTDPIDGENWPESNDFSVDQIGKSTIYVGDDEGRENNDKLEKENMTSAEDDNNNSKKEETSIKADDIKTDETSIKADDIKTDEISTEADDVKIDEISIKTDETSTETDDIKTDETSIEADDVKKDETLTETADIKKDKISIEKADVKKVEDNTQADKILPQTGETFPIVILIVISIVSIVSYIKLKKINY